MFMIQHGKGNLCNSTVKVGFAAFKEEVKYLTIFHLFQSYGNAGLVNVYLSTCVSDILPINPMAVLVFNLENIKSVEIILLHLQTQVFDRGAPEKNHRVVVECLANVSFSSNFSNIRIPDVGQ